MSNVAAFRTLTIEEATERLIDYRGKTPPKTDSGVRLVTAKVVKGGQIHDEPAEYIAADFYDEWMRRGLPRVYVSEMYRQKCSAVFEHVYESYPERNGGVYAEAYSTL